MPDNFITVEKFRDLVRGAPQGTNPEDLLGDLEDMGYEIEGYNAKYSALETVKNVPSSMVELGKGIVQFLKNPVKAVDTIGQVGLGALEKLIPGEQSSEKIFDAVKDMYVQRYGSVDKALNTIEQDPAGFLSDLSVLTGGGGAAAIKTGGAVLKSSKLLTAGEKIARFSRAIDPGIQTLNAAKKFNKATGFTKTLTSPIRKAAKHSSMKFAATGTEIPEKVEAIVATQQGINEVGAKLISEHGIHGTYKQMLDQARYIADKSKGLVDDLLADIDIQTRHNSVPKLIKAVQDKLGITSDATTNLLETGIEGRQLTIQKLKNKLSIVDKIDNELIKTQADLRGLQNKKAASTKPIVGLDNDIRNAQIKIKKYESQKLTEIADTAELSKLDKVILKSKAQLKELEARKLRSTLEPRELNKKITDTQNAINKLLEKRDKNTVKNLPLDKSILENKIAMEEAKLAVDAEKLSTATGLSTEMTGVVNRLRHLKVKHAQEGLTLSEANELKRISDKFIDAFNDMGQPKTSAKNFANLRGELQHHIETVAVDARIPASKRVPNLAKLNRQTQSWNELVKVFDYHTKTTRPYDKIKLLTEYAVTGGILGALSGGLPKVGLLMPFMGIITARHLLRLPQIRTYLASAMQLLSEGEFRALEGGLRNPAEIGKALPVIKKLNSGFKMMLPEWRASGVITGELDAQIRAAEFEENKRKAASRAGKKRKSIYKQ